MSVKTETNQLAVIVEQSGIAIANGAALLEAFQPYFNQAATLGQQATAISVTDATQVSEMKAARDLRLKLRKVRTEAENKRKELKSDYLKTGQAIDKVASVIEGMTAPIEAKLLEAEEFAERAEAARKAAMAANRAEMLKPYGIDPKFYDLANMPADQFNELVKSSAAAHAAKIEAQLQAERDRRAAEEAKAEEERKLREENERLRQERIAAEAKAKAEREAIEAKARAEREAVEEVARIEREAARKAQEEANAKLQAAEEARQRAVAEARKVREAEAAKAKAEADAARKAAKAPDATKIRLIADQIAAIPMPESMATEEGRQALAIVEGWRLAVTSKIRELATTL